MIEFIDLYTFTYKKVDPNSGHPWRTSLKKKKRKEKQTINRELSLRNLSTIRDNIRLDLPKNLVFASATDSSLICLSLR